MTRLIDADVLFEKVGKISPENKQQHDDIGRFINMITESPTVHVIPVEKPIGVVTEYKNGMVTMRKETYDKYQEIAVNEAVRKL